MQKQTPRIAAGPGGQEPAPGPSPNGLRSPRVPHPFTAIPDYVGRRLRLAAASTTRVASET
jgi:hypothetical protein